MQGECNIDLRHTLIGGSGGDILQLIFNMCLLLCVCTGHCAKRKYFLLQSAKSPNKEFQNALVAWLKKSLKVAKRHLKKRYRNRRQDKAHLGRLANYNLANNISDKRNNSYVYRMV